MEKEPITVEGLKKLQEELEDLKNNKRPKVVAAIAEARGHGDLKENAEYHAAKEQQGHIEGRDLEINDVIATDHAPHKAETKNVPFKDANRGVVGLESAFPLIYSSNIFDIDQMLKFLVLNPTKILTELGYEIPKTVNTWKKSKSVFTTKSIFKNSLFENENIEIERVLSGV